MIAIRIVRGFWRDESGIDIPSATWVVSAVFESRDRQSQMEAAAALDAHASDLCREQPGSFS